MIEPTGAPTAARTSGYAAEAASPAHELEADLPAGGGEGPTTAALAASAPSKGHVAVPLLDTTPPPARVWASIEATLRQEGRIRGR